MSDLRETIHPKPFSDAERVFLDYHDNSAWAKAKIVAGVHLFPESVAYMQRELDERARAAAERDKNLKEESPDAQRPPETHAPEPNAVRGNGSAPVGGLPWPGP